MAFGPRSQAFGFPEIVMGKRKAAALWYQLLEVFFSNSFSFLIFHMFQWLLHVWPLIYMLMSSKPQF